MKTQISSIFFLLMSGVVLSISACSKIIDPVGPGHVATPAPTIIFTPVPTMSPVPTNVPGGPTTICLSSATAQNLLYFDPSNVPPALDASGNSWSQAGYTVNSQWVTPTVVTAPPPEWTMACGPAWISSLASGIPSTLADTYYRNSFTVPAGTTVSNSTLTFSVDDGVEIWLNGNKVAYYPGSLISPDATRNYHICNTVSIPSSFFRCGTNILGFRVENLMTYEGLNYSVCQTAN